MNEYEPDPYDDADDWDDEVDPDKVEDLRAFRSQVRDRLGLAWDARNDQILASLQIVLDTREGRE